MYSEAGRINFRQRPSHPIDRSTGCPRLCGFLNLQSRYNRLACGMVRLFRVFIPVGVVILLITEVLLLVGVYVGAAYIGYDGDATLYLLEGSGWLNILLVVLTIVIGLYLHDLYTDVYVRSHLLLIQQLCFILGFAF